MGGRRWLRALGLRDQLLLLKSFIPTSSFNLRNLLLDGRISPLERLDVVLDKMLAKASVESRDKLWYQVRVLRSFRDSWQTWAGGLPLPRARRNIAIRETGVAVCLSLQVTPHFLLKESQVQLAESVRAQAAPIVAAVVANGRDGLQLVGDAVEGDRVDAVSTQGLEEQQRLEGSVGGVAVHEAERRLRGAVARAR